MKWRRGRVLAAICLAAIGATVTWCSLDEGKCGGRNRLAWSCVSWPTVGAFEAQLKRDLPRGTPQAAVEDYLTRKEIPYEFSFPIYPYFRKPIHFSKKLPASSEHLFGGGLAVEIDLNQEGAVQEIRVKTAHNAK